MVICSAYKSFELILRNCDFLQLDILKLIYAIENK